MAVKVSTEQFIEKAKAVHGDKYDYSLVVYVATALDVILICPTHGRFKQTPHNHLRGSGCSVCANTQKNKTTEHFIEQAKNIHGNKYDYSNTVYVKSNVKTSILCPTHGEFLQTPNNHLYGYGCAKCAGVAHKTTAQFVQQAKDVHGSKYDYSYVEYKQDKTKIKIVCPLHGPFYQRPNNHITSKQGCPQCSDNTTKNSKVAIDWLSAIAEQENIYIQHADNDGEFIIPGTKLRADGYCETTNTIYEFHGSAWHGDPSIYDPGDHCHPRDRSVTAGELHYRTILREQVIRGLGYNLVVCWESDYVK